MRVVPYLDFAYKVVKSNLGRPTFPFKLTLVSTFWCNYKCKTCNIWKKKPKDELTAEEIDRFFARSNKFSWIDVTGGEVSLREDFPAICESIVRHNRNLLLLHFPTNGYLTDRIVQQTKEVLKLRPPKLIITISTDGDETLNDEIRGIPGGYRRQIETFRQLRALKHVDVVLGMTLSRHNADKFELAFQAAQREIPNLHPREFHVNIMHESSHYFGNAEDPSAGCSDDDDLKETLIRETNRFARMRGLPWKPVDYLERAYLKQVETYLRSGITPMQCHALKSSCFIDSWGTVFPCSIYDRPLGNLRDHDYDLGRIWMAEETVRVQQEIWEKKCPQCWTPCEAYQTIMGNFFRRKVTGMPEPEQPSVPLPRPVQNS